EDFVELVHWLGWTIAEVQDVDDKVGNGFTLVIQVANKAACVETVASKIAISALQPMWAHPSRSAVPQTPNQPIVTPSTEPSPRPLSTEIAFGSTDPSLPPYVEIGAHSYYVPRETRFLGYVPGERIIIGKYCSIARDVTILVGGNHTTETVSTYPFDTWFL